jgi:hypothetical protein
VAARHDREGPDRLTAVPTVVRSGDAFNVVPASGELLCDVRLGTRDTVMASIESIRGTAGANELTGNDSSNTLFGLAGADDLHGLGASDEIQANEGTADDITCGGGGGDHVFVDAMDIYPITGPDACELVN